MSIKGDNAPIIIKRKKVVKGGGHHGGAWKVAYADFVTAMMAFFLLMWLLNATTEKQRKGIADYFNPTIPVFRVSGGGDGAFGGTSIFSQEELAKTGTGASDGRSAVANNPQGAADQKFAEVENLLRGNSGESSVADTLLQQVSTRVTDKGLIIDLFDLENSPLFRAGTSVPTEKMEMLLQIVADAIGIVTNKIAIIGHTDSRRADGRDPFILSANRAQMVRQRLLAAGIPETRMDRVTGNADRSPAAPNASIYRNRRIEIILLRRLAGENTKN